MDTTLDWYCYPPLYSYPTACMVTSDDVISLVLPDSLPTLQALCFPLIGIYAGRLGRQEVKVPMFQNVSCQVGLN